MRDAGDEAKPGGWSPAQRAAGRTIRYDEIAQQLRSPDGDPDRVRAEAEQARTRRRDRRPHRLSAADRPQGAPGAPRRDRDHGSPRGGFAVTAALGDFPDVAWRFRPAALLLSIAGLTVFLACNGEIWRRLLRSLGPELRPIRAQALWSASALGRYVPTSALLPVLRVALSERQGVPKRITLASLVYETALVLTASVIIGAYFVVTLPGLAAESQRFLVLAVPVLALVALQPQIFHRLADYTLRRLGRAPLPVSLGAWRILRFIGLYLFSMLIAGLSLYALAQCFYPTDLGDLPTVVGAFAVATTFSFLAFLLPGGLVAREAAMTLALSPVMPAAPALAIAVLSRIMHLAIEVTIALAAPLLARLRLPRADLP
jgi:glycosyltransferase 2 family protein